MKKLLIIALFTISVNSIMAQAKSIYFELGGPGLASINYECVLQKVKTVSEVVPV